MKPRLVPNWPKVKEDNDIIARKIKEAINKYQISKKEHLLG